MTRLIWGLALILAQAPVALAGPDGGPDSPEFFRLQQGNKKDGAVRTCSTTTSLLVDGDGNRRVWVARLAPGVSTTVHICCDAQFSNTTSGGVPTATPAPCNTPAAIQIDSTLPGYREGDSAKVRCRCWAASSASVLVTESEGN